MVPKLWFVGFHCVFVVVFVCFWFFCFAWGSIRIVDSAARTPQSGGPARPRWFPNFVLLVFLVFVVFVFVLFLFFGFRYPREARAPQSGGQARPGWFPNYVCWFSLCLFCLFLVVLGFLF